METQSFVKEFIQVFAEKWRNDRKELLGEIFTILFIFAVMYLIIFLASFF